MPAHSLRTFSIRTLFFGSLSDSPPAPPGFQVAGAICATQLTLLRVSTMFLTVVLTSSFAAPMQSHAEFLAKNLTLVMLWSNQVYIVLTLKSSGIVYLHTVRYIFL